MFTWLTFRKLMPVCCTKFNVAEAVMALSRLRAFSSRHPIIINAISLSTLFAGADISQQTFQGVEHYDRASPVRMATLASGFYAPVYYIWYNWLDRALPGTAPRTIAKKVLMDQGIVGAIGSFAFFFGNALLERKGPKTSLQETKEKWPTAYFTGWVYWPVAQSINFLFLPTAFRTVYVGMAAFVWTNFLVYIKSFKSTSKDHAK